jgi:hypothetical protein
MIARAALRGMVWGFAAAFATYAAGLYVLRAIPNPYGLGFLVLLLPLPAVALPGSFVAGLWMACVQRELPSRGFWTVSALLGTLVGVAVGIPLIEGPGMLATAVAGVLGVAWGSGRFILRMR